MQSITLFVPIYLKKFITKTYGKEPVLVRADSDLGKLFRLAINRDNYIPADAFEVEENFLTDRKEGLVKLKFGLSFRFTRCKLTHENFLRLTDALENEFHKAMYFYTRGMRRVHISENASVKRFLDEFEINADCLDESSNLKIATAIKSVQRQREKKECLS